MNKFMYIALCAFASTFLGHASDVWNWDDQFYQTHLRPQVKEIGKARQSYEHLLRTTEDFPKSVRNPFVVLGHLKQHPATIQQMRTLKAKNKLTTQEYDRMLDIERNYAKYLNMMNQLGRENYHPEIGSWHPDVSKFIRSYINNPEVFDQPITYYGGYQTADEIMKNLSIKPLDNYQGAIREQIQEHKLSRLFNQFTARVFNRNRK